jgi:hypothetical protein
MASKQQFKQGDEVEWDTPQGTTKGTVKRRITTTERIGNDGQKGTEVKGTEDDPRYLVESASSGKQAAHKPEALRKATR